MLVIGPLLLYAIWFACAYVLNCIMCFHLGATTNVRLLLFISLRIIHKCVLYADFMVCESL